MKSNIFDVITTTIGGTILIGCIFDIIPTIMFAISIILGSFLLIRYFRKLKIEKNDNNN